MTRGAKRLWIAGGERRNMDWKVLASFPHAQDRTVIHGCAAEAGA
jgi:hypothetical protein